MNQEQVLKSLQMENSILRAEYLSKYGNDEEIRNELLGNKEKISLDFSENLN